MVTRGQFLCGTTSLLPDDTDVENKSTSTGKVSQNIVTDDVVCEDKGTNEMRLSDELFECMCDFGDV